MEHVEFTCSACGLSIVGDVSPPLSEGEGPFLQLFWCEKEKKSMVLDAEAEGFRGHCPGCGGPVALLRSPLASCPRCLAPAKKRRAYTGPL